MRINAVFVHSQKLLIVNRRNMSCNLNINLFHDEVIYKFVSAKVNLNLEQAFVLVLIHSKLPSMSDFIKLQN